MHFAYTGMTCEAFQPSLEPTIHVTHFVHAELKALSVWKCVYTFEKVYTLLDISVYTFGQQCIHFFKKCIHFWTEVYTLFKKCIHFWTKVYTLLESVYTSGLKCIHFFKKVYTFQKSVCTFS